MKLGASFGLVIENDPPRLGEASDTCSLVPKAQRQKMVS